MTGAGRMPREPSDTAAFRGSAAVVGDRGDVLDAVDFHTGGSDASDSGFTAGAGALDADFDVLHAEGLRLFGGVGGHDLRGVRGALAGALEAVLAGGGPGDHVAVKIGEGNFGIVERGVNERDAAGDVAAGFLALVVNRGGLGGRSGGFGGVLRSSGGFFDFVISALLLELRSALSINSLISLMASSSQ